MTKIPLYSLWMTTPEWGTPSAFSFVRLASPPRYSCRGTNSSRHTNRTWAGCLVLDVRMPGMSGIDLQARLQEMESTLPIIFVTAHGDVPMAVEAVKAGAVDFIQKPFRDQELLDKVQEAMEVNARNRSQRQDLAEIRSRLESLTPRETEVLDLVVAGKAQQEHRPILGDQSADG